MSTKLWQRIKEARRRADITQQNVADARDLSRNAVTSWESENTPNEPSIDALKTICELTGAPITWLIDNESGLEDDWNLDGHFSLSKDEKRLVHLYRRAEDNTKSTIRAFAEFSVPEDFESGKEEQTALRLEVAHSSK